MAPSDQRAALGRTIPAVEFDGRAVLASTTAVAGGGDAPDLGGAEVWTELARRGLAPGREQAARFADGRLLGVGSTGRVYSVLDRSLSRRIAVKVLDRDAVRDAASLGSFVEEAQLTAALKHPNVLPVLDIDVTAAGQPYFSMSQIEGRTLGEVLQESTAAARHRAIVSPNAVVSIFIAICHAVAYAHHQRIVHQDIKPDNILIGDFGEVLVLDWGCAARLDAATPAIYGTPLYMSPEQARQERVDERSDVFCIGATLLHALVLRLPVWRDDPDAFWAAKRAGAVDAPSVREREGVPAELISIALKATAADPAARYATVEAMRGDLERYQAGLAVSAHRESAWRRFRRWYGANRAFFWAAAIAAAAFATAGGVAVRAELLERPAWTRVFDESFAGEPIAKVAERWSARTGLNFLGPLVDHDLTDAAVFSTGPGGLTVAATTVPVDLCLRAGIPGDIRIEWISRPLDSAKNLNCFIGGPDRRSGLTIHVGGFSDRSLVTLTRGEDRPLVYARMPEPLRSGRAYRFLLEYDDRHLRFAVDGRQYIDYVDVDAVVSPTLQQFGFDAFPVVRHRLERVTVWRRVPGKRVSPLEVADRLYQLRHWEEAELQYQGLVDAYPGSDFAVAAQYRLIRCAVERERQAEAGTGQPPSGEAERRNELIASHLRDFAKRYPASAEAPLALAEILRMRLAAREPPADEIAELRQQLKAYRGNPVLMQVLIDLGAERAKNLRQVPAADFTASQYPPDIVRRVDDELATMRRWSEDYGVPLVRNPLIDLAVDRLNYLGLHRRALAACVDDQQRQHCLFGLGAFDELLRLDTGNESLTAAALMWLGRFGEVADDHTFLAHYRAFAALLRGDDDEAVRRLEPSGDAAWARRLQEGRFEEYLAEHPTDDHGFDWGDTTRVRVLIAAGHADRVLREYTHTSARARAYLALGDPDAALKESPWDAELWQEVAVRRLGEGRRDEARRIVERLAGAPMGYNDNDRYFEMKLFPAAAFAILGETDRARALLRTVRDGERDGFGQRLWHIAAYALGDIDDRRFLAQPSRALVEARLLLAQGLKLELSGDARGAAERYRDLLALPFHRSLLQEGERAFLEWRVRAQGMQPARGFSVPVSIQ